LLTDPDQQAAVEHVKDFLAIMQVNRTDVAGGNRPTASRTRDNPVDAPATTRNPGRRSGGGPNLMTSLTAPSYHHPVISSTIASTGSDQPRRPPRPDLPTTPARTERGRSVHLSILKHFVGRLGPCRLQGPPNAYLVVSWTGDSELTDGAAAVGDHAPSCTQVSSTSA
jgi:hypothetical protein